MRLPRTHESDPGHDMRSERVTFKYRPFHCIVQVWPVKLAIQGAGAPSQLRGSLGSFDRRPRMPRMTGSNRRRAASLALTVSALAIGCASAPSISYDQMLASWVGSSADSLVRAWGPPTATLRLEGGRQQYVYEQRPSAVDPPPAPGGGLAGAGMSNPTRRPPLTVEQWCRTTFEVDATGKIIGSEYTGNSCTTRR